MKKLVFAFIVMMMCLCCSKRQCSTQCVKKDSIVTIVDIDDKFEIPLDSFLQIEDSFIYSTYEKRWMTKKLYYSLYSPDSCLNRRLDSLNASGEYLLVRGADRYCDTIIDHIHYIFITEE